MSDRKTSVAERRINQKAGKIRSLYIRRVQTVQGNTHFYLQVGSILLKCHLGKHGVTYFKREGDLKTPRGRFTIMGCFFRDDRFRRIQSCIPTRPIRADDTWCDDEDSYSYNRFRTFRLAASHERLWRNDELYDFCLPLNYNFSPRVRGRGSAIFLHVSNPAGYTAGCVAIECSELRKMIPRLARKCVVVI